MIHIVSVPSNESNTNHSDKYLLLCCEIKACAKDYKNTLYTLVEALNEGDGDHFLKIIETETAKEEGNKNMFDLTPTWVEFLPSVLLLLEHGDAEGAKVAKAQLIKMAIAADKYNTQNKKPKP